MVKKGNQRPLTAILRFVQSPRNFCFSFLLLALVVYIITIQFQKLMNIYRTINKRCNGTLELTEEEVLEKISSYRFPGTDKYIEYLFPTFDVPERMPDFPRFVTGLSFDHFKEGMRMIRSLHAMLGERYPYLELYVYDVGLSVAQQNTMQEECNCTFRKFPFDQFPDHIGIIKNLAWKPLVMQLMVREHPFVIWVDASLRFTTTNIDPLLEAARRTRAVSAPATSKVPERTMMHMFEAFEEEPCLFRDADVYGTWMVILYPSGYEMKYLLKQWVSCALLPRCIATGNEPTSHRICDKDKLFSCHRFDQSAWSILLHRLYHKRAHEHVLGNDLRKLFKKCSHCDVNDTKQYLEGSQGH